MYVFNDAISDVLDETKLRLSKPLSFELLVVAGSQSKMKIFILLLCINAAFAWDNIIDALTSFRKTTLLGLINDAGLADTLKGAGPITMFAPSDRSISNLDVNFTAALHADKVQLANILKYHIIADSITFDDLKVNERSLTTLSGDKIRLNHYVSTGATTINGIPISSSRYPVDNGALHFINGFLKPPVGNIVDVIKSDPELGSLFTAITAAGLSGFLTDNNPITIFAPTNEAFNRLGSVLTQKIIADKNLLKTILTYHVVHGSLYSAGFHSSYLHTFDTADKSRLHRFFVFGYEINSASITIRDIPANNGVVHKIRDVLIPDSVKAQVDALRPPPVTIAPST